MKLIVLAVLSTVVAGCTSAPTDLSVDASTAKTFSVKKITDSGKSTKQLDQENQELIEAKLAEVLNFCLPRLSGYEQKSANQARMAYWLSMSGLLAGSVAVPALAAASPSANAAWVAGLGGWAGATNFAGQALKESGLSGSAIAQTRNEIIRGVTDQIEAASDGAKTFEERRNALMKARASCVMYEIAVPTIPSNA
ncbi:hypothetical protein [Idiomarina ramblicola]|uniref:Lipoprotein n=1 Tax=Idiomarina ramblicola TaxID=263724 RepID=A0A432Z6B8_9GAMM|nr:hypothetical protein [Idiomarina ramblicola]RUO73444.1 hypothetical protein CWI78_03165 [Idiomarina ramblicola]